MPRPDRTPNGIRLACVAVNDWNLGAYRPATLEELVVAYGAGWDPPVTLEEAAYWLDMTPRSLLTQEEPKEQPRG